MKDHETVGDNRIIQKKKRSTPISENYISIQIIISEYQLKNQLKKSQNFCKL